MNLIFVLAVSVITTSLIFLLLRSKWCLYQRTWYYLMTGAAPLNGFLGWFAFTHLGFSITAVCIGSIILSLVEIPLLILPFFIRDPERKVPQINGAIISPADGKVVYVKTVESGKIPVSDKNGSLITLSEFSGTSLITQGSKVIGIAMNFLDVHVNRSPVEGTIRKVVHVPGQFLSLRNPESLARNERQSILVENGKMQVGIVQIASRLVRRIVSFVKEGQKVSPGQRVGAIRFGSQVDVIIPLKPHCEIHVKTGDVVRAGITVLASEQKHVGQMQVSSSGKRSKI
jgi:phosphatidylserine decarboxylase